MGNWWTGRRWSDVEGGTWLRESWGAKKCDGNGVEGTWRGVLGGMWGEAWGGAQRRMRGGTHG